MDWEYYVDNDFTNSIVRAGFIYLGFKLWLKHTVRFLKILFRINQKIFLNFFMTLKITYGILINATLI